jgi:hypothetical protein
MSSKPLSVKAKPFQVAAKVHKVREERVFTGEMQRKLELALRAPLAPISDVWCSVLKREDTIGMEIKEMKEMKALAEEVVYSVIEE